MNASDCGVCASGAGLTVEVVEMRSWEPGSDPETDPGQIEYALCDIRYRDEPADGPHYGGLNWQGCRTREEALAWAAEMGMTVTAGPTPSPLPPVASLARKRAEKAVGRAVDNGKLIRRGDGTLIEPDDQQHD